MIFNNMIEPTVDILLSIYKPKYNWFIKQLKSINDQTYKHLRLIIANDCPSDCINYEKIILDLVSAMDVVYYVNEKNLGTTKSFEGLLKKAQSDYVAFCDQDDIWLPEKIETLVKCATKSGSDLVCSDMEVIDRNDTVVFDSISDLRRRQDFDVSDDLKRKILFQNYVYGCAMLIKTDIAKSALPIPSVFYHDWWLAIYTVLNGRVDVVKRPLIKYRIAGQNQTGFLNGISNKSDYYKRVIFDKYLKINEIKKKFTGCGVDGEIYFLYEHYTSLCNLYESKNVLLLFNLMRSCISKYFSGRVIREMLDCFFAFMPDVIFKLIIKSCKCTKSLKMNNSINIIINNIMKYINKRGRP